MTTNPTLLDGDWVRQARKARGLTQEELAELAGCTRKTVYHLERDTLKRGTTRSTMEAIERALKAREQPGRG